MKLFITFLSMTLLLNLGYSQSLNNHVEPISLEEESSTTTVQYVRKNVNTPGGQADLASMSVAFAKLRNMDCNINTGWYYQGAIHNIPSLINGPNELCDSYQNSNDKKFAWGDCTHTGTAASSLHFLLWHRMYTWHLEKIVRELSGNADFALPYWNYGSTIEDENKLALQLRTMEDPLFEPARYSVLNYGGPIDQITVRGIQDQLSALAKNPTFSGSAGFSNSLETSPHNLMHGYIGGGPNGQTMYNEILQRNNQAGLMGIVASAGFDPVFWLHHAMIDRIWAQWDASSVGVRPSLAELQNSPWDYNFIEPDGTQITYTMTELYNTVFNLDYTYDILLDAKPMLASAKMKQPKKMRKRNMSHTSQTEPKEKNVWTHSIGKVIKHDANSFFRLPVTAEAHNETNKLIKLARQNLILTLDVSVYKEPRSYYTVYIKYPNEDEKYIGKMTFFGVNHTHGTEKQHSLGEEGAQLQFSYYVHEELKHSGAKFEVIIKKNGRDDAKVTLDKISLSSLSR